MASGDAQRVWFPEMLEELKEYWSPNVPWDDVIEFCDLMTEMRKELGISKGIKPPMMKCHGCDKRVRAAYPEISVRSLIFNLRKVGAVSEEELKELDRSWKRYQRKNSLTGYGKKK